MSCAIRHTRSFLSHPPRAPSPRAEWALVPCLPAQPFTTPFHLLLFPTADTPLSSPQAPPPPPQPPPQLQQQQAQRQSLAPTQVPPIDLPLNARLIAAARCFAALPPATLRELLLIKDQTQATCFHRPCPTLRGGVPDASNT